MTLAERSLGWLRHLHRTVHAADRTMHAPVRWKRRESADSAHALALMAHRTPAWTEPHVAVLDRLIEQHIAGWPATDGALADEPSFLVLLGTRSMIDNRSSRPHDRWNEPFELLDDEGAAAAWTHHEIAEQVAKQFVGRSPDEPMSARQVEAGLGLRLHDQRYGTDDHQRVYDPWWNRAREPQVDLGGGAELMATAFHAAPQHRDDARQMFDSAWESVELGERPRLPRELSRTAGMALLLAKEWELGEIEAQLTAAIERSFEPTWNDGEFSWTMGLEDAQRIDPPDAILAAAEANGADRWRGVSAAPLERCAQVVGVDVADMAFDRAEWVDGNLHLGLVPRVEDPERFTYFRVVGAEPRMWDVHGVENARIESKLSGLDVRVPMVRSAMTLIRSSY